MTSISLLAPVLGAATTESRPVLVAIAPAALGIAIALVLLTVAAVVALVLEVRRDGYGLDRPRPLSREYPWQTEPAPRRRRFGRAADSWTLLRAARTAHR
jgi:hypothetical protein